MPLKCPPGIVLNGTSDDSGGMKGGRVERKRKKRGFKDSRSQFLLIEERALASG
jgi:hypothetical protein